MIVVSVKLLSAISPDRDCELARMRIINDGTGTLRYGDYNVEIIRGRSTEELSKGKLNKTARVEHYARLHQHVWNLVCQALTAAGYGL